MAWREAVCRGSFSQQPLKVRREKREGEKGGRERFDFGTFVSSL